MLHSLNIYTAINETREFFFCHSTVHHCADGIVPV